MAAPTRTQSQVACGKVIALGHACPCVLKSPDMLAADEGPGWWNPLGSGWSVREPSLSLPRAVAGGCIHPAWSLELAMAPLVCQTNNAAMLQPEGFLRRKRGVRALAAGADAEAARFEPAPLFAPEGSGPAGK